MGRQPPPAPEPEEPPTSNARVATELLRMAKLICARRKGTGGRVLKVGAYIDSLIRGPIMRDYEAAIKEIAEEQKKSRP